VAAARAAIGRMANFSACAPLMDLSEYFLERFGFVLQDSQWPHIGPAAKRGKGTVVEILIHTHQGQQKFTNPFVTVERKKRYQG
jgi:hypothetical protein